MLPLPGREKQPSLGNTGNFGLYYQKFFSFWPSNFDGKIEAGHKQKWVNECSRSLPGNKVAADRLIKLARNCRGYAEEFVTTSPFVTGMGLPHAIENGFLFHHTLGVPYLSGSSIKGLLRAWGMQWEDGEALEGIGRLFGRDDKHPDGPGAGLIIVFDALPVGPVKLIAEVITSHTGGWRNAVNASENPPADWVSPNPIPFLAVAPDTKFQFALGLRADGTEADLAKAFEYLELALEWIGAGAKTAIGLGRFQKPGLAQMQQMQMKADMKEAEKNKPIAVGDRANHDDWGTVEVRAVEDQFAIVFSLDEQETVKVPLTELRKKK